jgi:hypothetical protein
MGCRPETAAKMKDCRWLKPVLVAQIDFLEWTGDNHLRHSKFIGLREDKPALGCPARVMAAMAYLAIHLWHNRMYEEDPSH